MLASGQLGSHKGLPVTMVISTTLAELESGRGHAVTGGGTLLPMAEVIRQAAAAHHYLAVFDDHTEQPSIWAERNGWPPRRNESCCTRATVAARSPAAPHRPTTAKCITATADWAAGGLTNIDDETLACGGQTTAASNPAAGAPANAKTAAPNGSRRPTWIPAKPESTTTTTPSATSSPTKAVPPAAVMTRSRPRPREWAPSYRGSRQALGAAA